MAIKCEAGKLINIAWRHFSINLLKPEYFRMLEAGTAQEEISYWLVFKIRNIFIRHHAREIHFSSWIVVNFNK